MAKLVVYGHTGMVGSQLYRWLRKRGVDVAGVSLDKCDGEIGVPEWAFLCLPTPTGPDGKQDQEAIWDVLCETEAKNIVVRSTVLPGSCDYLHSTWANKRFYHWPEFLSARTAWYDFCNPQARFVGCDMTHPSITKWRTEIEPLLPMPEHAPSYMYLRNSETIKYLHNVHGAMQVIFANQMRDVCGDDDSWELMRLIAPRLGYISQEQVSAYWDVWKDGKRGYGGACFPKDVGALRAWCESNGIGHELLDGMEEANARLRGEA